MREDNSRENATYVYVYDGNGNMLEKNKYAYGYTDAAHKDTAGSVSYTYSTGDWKDLLTRIGNRTIVSDASGNPLNWTGAYSALTWTGRRLDTYTPDGNTLISYYYNSEGLRTKKAVTSSGTTTEYEYVYDGGELIRETRTVKTGETVTSQKAIDYLRLGGELIGFRLYGSSGNAVDYTSYDDYFYARTANGEIRIIYDEDGFVAARYSYDAWGRITGIDEEYSSCIDALNSIRYKDYYYDTESGFYYLQSRYYDPVVGRFISADSTDYLGASGTVLSFNLFAYCENGPVFNTDLSGTLAFNSTRNRNIDFLIKILEQLIPNIYTDDIWKHEWPLFRIGIGNLFIQMSVGIAVQTNKNALFGGLFKRGTIEVSYFLGINSFACFSISSGITLNKTYIKIGLLLALPKPMSGAYVGVYIEVSIPTWLAAVATVAVAAASAYCPAAGAFVGKTIVAIKSSSKVAASLLVAIIPQMIFALA